MKGDLHRSSQKDKDTFAIKHTVKNSADIINCYF